MERLEPNEAVKTSGGVWEGQEAEWQRKAEELGGGRSVGKKDGMTEGKVERVILAAITFQSEAEPDL